MKKAFAYRDVVYQQGDDSYEALQILENYGEKAAIEHLSNLYDHGEGEICMREPWGSDDKVCFMDGYYLIYNDKIAYIHLCMPVEKSTILEAGGQESIEMLQQNKYIFI